MKNVILLAAFFLYGSTLFAQETEEIGSFEVVYAYLYASSGQSLIEDEEKNAPERKHEGQYILFHAAPLSAKSPWGISTLLAGDATGWAEGFVGPAYLKKNLSFGLMVGFENTVTVWRLCPWFSFQTKNERFSGLFVYEQGATTSWQKVNLWYRVLRTTYIKTNVGIYVHGNRAGLALGGSRGKLSGFIAPYMKGFGEDKNTPASMVSIGFEF